jgi:hypothetical protein
LLVIELGFRLHLDATQPYGFDVEKTLSCDYWLRKHLQCFDPAPLQALLHATVAALQQEIPGLGASTSNPECCTVRVPKQEIGNYFIR